MNKRIKKYRILCCVLVVCTAFLSGCFPTVKKNSEIEHDNNVNEYSTHIEDNDIDKLIINLDVIVPSDFNASENVAISNAKLKSWSKEDVVSKLSNGRTVKSEHTGYNEGPGDDMYICDYDDSATITIYNGGIRYTTKKSKEKEYTFYFDNSENYIYENNFNELFSDKSIVGVSKEDALTSANQILTTLGIIELAKNPQLYTMDTESVNKIQKNINLKNKHGDEVDKWEEKDEAYLIIYKFFDDNIPALPIDTIGLNEKIDSSYAYFLYGESGLIAFEIRTVFDNKSKVKESNIISPDTALDVIRKRYENIIIESDISISYMKLGYICRRKFGEYSEIIVQPVWYIGGEISAVPSNDIKQSTDQKMMVLIDAITGEEIEIK